MLKERRTKSTVKIEICVRKFCKDRYDKESFFSKKKSTSVKPFSKSSVIISQIQLKKKASQHDILTESQQAHVNR